MSCHHLIEHRYASVPRFESVDNRTRHQPLFTPSREPHVA
jgi:hypothetical protein